MGRCRGKDEENRAKEWSGRQSAWVRTPLSEGKHYFKIKGPVESGGSPQSAGDRSTKEGTALLGLPRERGDPKKKRADCSDYEDRFFASSPRKRNAFTENLREDNVGDHGNY